LHLVVLPLSISASAAPLRFLFDLPRLSLVITPAFPLQEISDGLLVRRMTGALVAAGQGLLSVSQVKQILDSRDTLAYPQGVVAPAQGLFLKSVDYEESACEGVKMKR
ncbi:hypothetical protein GOODEAATRI_026129, partial [Goodea atripinnis]